jgi:hypothetical protein
MANSITFTYQNPYVLCRIERVEREDPYSSTPTFYPLGLGIARCSVLDVYSPKKGAEIALARALANIYDLKAESVAKGPEGAWHRNGWPNMESALDFERKLLKKAGLR